MALVDFSGEGGFVFASERKAQLILMQPAFGKCTSMLDNDVKGRGNMCGTNNHSRTFEISEASEPFAMILLNQWNCSEMLEPCEPSKTGDDSKTSEIIDIEMQNAKIQLCRMSAVRPEVKYTRLFINNQWVDAVSGRGV